MKPRINLVGQQFGRLTVIAYDQELSDLKQKSHWKCQCICGSVKSIEASGLKSGRTQSCGCYNKERTRESLLEDLTTQTFGNLQPIAYMGKHIWQCQCECGNVIQVHTQSLKRHLTQSCGCIKRSIGEQNIENILLANNVNYIREYTFTDFQNARYDFYLPDMNRLIEFDGIQHYEESRLFDKKISFQERKNKDIQKNNYALSNNIDLVRIPYWERDAITLDMIMGDKYLI